MGGIGVTDVDIIFFFLGFEYFKYFKYLKRLELIYERGLKYSENFSDLFGYSFFGYKLVGQIWNFVNDSERCGRGFEIYRIN